MRAKYHLKNYRISLVIFLVLLSSIGILLVRSANESYHKMQIIGVTAGLICMVAVSLIPYHFILIFYRVLYVINLLFLILVRFWGEDSKGATRWLKIGGFQFQPSELCKIILILFFAQYIMEHEEDFNSPKTIVKSLLFFAIPTYLVYKQPDLSTTIIICLIFATILFVGGLSYKIIAGVLGVMIPAIGVFLWFVVNKGNSILEEYQYDRIMAWLNPQAYLDTTFYQQNNSMIAIGSGMLTGKGLNNNVIGSVKNGNFISEPQTDFIFSIAGEELGFIGCFVMIALMAAIVVSCLLLARQAQDLAGKIICVGVCSIVGYQSFVNICVTVGLMPNTGLPLPFVSYGLSSMISLFLGMGVVLNVGLQRRRFH